MGRFDHPAIFWLTMTILVVAGMWLLSLGSKAIGFGAGAKFFGGPTSVES